MRIIQAGDYWVADIRYTDGSASKKRPVLILWLDGQDSVVAAVTTSPPRTSTDIFLADWHECGLRAPSTARLSRLDCLEQSTLLFRLGHVSPADAGRLKDAWDTFIHPQF